MRLFRGLLAALVVCITIISADASLTSITGYAMADGSRVYREFSPSSVAEGDTLTVKLHVVINGAHDFYAIEEKVPSDWTVIIDGGGGTPIDNVLKWVEIQSAVSVTYIYSVKAPNTAGTYTFSGEYGLEGMTNPATAPIEDDKQITVTAGCTPTEEVCDGIDNNCNTEIDEGFDGDDCQAKCEAEGGKNYLKARGGTLRCCGDDTGEDDPYETTETTCDDHDNDCDGTPDEMKQTDPNNCGACDYVCDLPNVAVHKCTSGVCGIQQCASGWADPHNNPTDGCELSCTPSNGGYEICDGKDNDCDGDTDEGYTVETCSFVCLAVGDTNYLASRKAGLKCCGDDAGEDDPYETTEQSCDGSDNDCDGTVDEVILTDPNNCGACDNVCNLLNVAVHKCTNGECGIQQCASGWADPNNNPTDGCELSCTPSNGGYEICDGKDNDCNNQTDEGYTVETCSFVCLAVGDTNYLASRQAGLKCCGNDAGEDNPYETTEQSCDENDNDCDGTVDEMMSTDPNNCGACDYVCDLPHVQSHNCVNKKCGVLTCAPGFINVDSDPTNGCELLCTPSNGGYEICDGVDNDCDNQTDEGFTVETCEILCLSNGGDNYMPSRGPNLKCCGDNQGEDNPYEVDEISCDGNDNDCDGTVDEVILTDPNNCGACDNVCNLLNVAVHKCTNGECGIQQCASGWADPNNNPTDGCELSCTPSNGGYEICDGKDNDCNNQTDEGFTAENCRDVCLSIGGIDFNPSRTAGKKCCGDEANENNPFQQTESLCDNSDNNCNGQVDEIKLTDPNNCGTCGFVCNLLHVNTHTCVNGECNIVTCDSAWVDLNNDPIDGCEMQCTPTNSGIEICDGMDNNCDGTTDESFTAETCLQVCLSSGGINFNIQRNTNYKCCGNDEYEANPYEPVELSCDNYDNDCDGTIDEVKDDDPDNCGTCGNVCNLPNVQTHDCETGTCKVITCVSGFADINEVSSDGCEVVCQETNGGVEICDGQDNDCNGQTDEDFLPEDCQATCIVAGGVNYNQTRSKKCCGNDEGEANPYQDDETACDSNDNDCDGQLDEGCDDVQTCVENWQCADWSLCGTDQYKRRTCTDTNTCGTSLSKPNEIEVCSYNASCADGLMNGNEEGVDCGGTCPACSIDNPTETPIDNKPTTVPIIEIIAQPIDAKLIETYPFYVKIKNLGTETVENIELSLNKYSNEVQKFDLMLPGDERYHTFALTIPPDSTDGELQVQVLYANSPVTTKKVSINLIVPEYALVIKDDNGELYPFIVIDNRRENDRRLGVQYTVVKNDETYFVDSIRDFDVEKGKVYQKTESLPLKNLPDGTYIVKGQFFEEGAKIAETESTITIDSGRRAKSAKFLFYLIMFLTIGASVYVYLQVYTKR